jgi:hypothetical protein
LSAESRRRDQGRKDCEKLCWKRRGCGWKQPCKSSDRGGWQITLLCCDLGRAIKCAVPKSVIRREFIALFGGAAAWSLATHADQPAWQRAEATPANLPHIEMVRVKPTDREPAKPRLSDSLVDLMKGFSLPSSQGIGGTWKLPPYVAVSGDTFDERYGAW